MAAEKDVCSSAYIAYSDGGLTVWSASDRVIDIYGSVQGMLLFECVLMIPVMRYR